MKIAIGQAQQLVGRDSLVHVAGEFANEEDVHELASEAAFNHVATLVFPDSVDDVRSFLAESGFDTSATVASTVVRNRLARRYGVPEESLEVSIILASSRSDAQVGVEVFAVPRSCAERAAPGMVADERAHDWESHLAWVLTGDPERARRICTEKMAMVPDGGGYNPHQDVESGGRSVLYFRAPVREGLPARFELTCAGHYPDVLAAHIRSGAEAPGAPTKLLSILAGHWAARAVHVAVEIGLCDVLGQGPLTAGDVAQQTDCDPAAVDRLLRYLTHLGVVRRLGENKYSNTPLGALLRADSPFSDLTRMYGGEFYDAWREFASAVRTGHTAFSHKYGVEHFDYFAERPTTARTFDRSMQAVTNLVADELSRTFPFPAGAMVVDIGGGNGTLLRAILRENPEVSGILFDREHVSCNAVAEHEDASYRSRFSSVAGDFFAEVPGSGDIYLLSRVLHDWNDEDCVRILAACRRACGAGAELLVLERLLPDAETGAPDISLTAPWDMQMLAITGGRERTRSEYGTLLTKAGFRLDEVRPLPVDMNVLVAVPAAAGPDGQPGSGVPSPGFRAR
ncbi:methyltransferase [Saccharopolyspora erythraea]|uniref:methyltransferase n=1 Tax=Saccharopolyspora erythraea TaxID=1836 RepID=UPI0001D315CB|nr:methyltransferase [Saccharopolyspora erythraea]EQD83469.1 SAM-dependent methyltransferase [Saccharopolyspora erythraea D]